MCIETRVCHYKKIRYDCLQKGTWTKEEKEKQKLAKELEETRIQLSDRTIDIQNAGTLAEAVFSLNGVYKAVDAAAQHYLENIKKRDEECRIQCEKILDDARIKADEIISEAKKKSEK